MVRLSRWRIDEVQLARTLAEEKPKERVTGFPFLKLHAGSDYQPQQLIYPCPKSQLSEKQWLWGGSEQWIALKSQLPAFGGPTKGKWGV